MAIAYLGYRVDSDQIKKADTRLDKMGKSAGGAQRSSANLARTARNLAIQFGAVAAAFTAVRGLFNASQQYTQLTNTLRGMGLSADEAAATLVKVGEVANRTRAPLAATAKLYQRISIAGKDLGASSQSVLQFTENVGMALASAGVGANEARGALLQLSQAMAGGVVRAEEFNSILEGAFPIAQAAANGIAEAEGSVGKLRNMVIDGKVSSEAFFNSILSQTAELEEAFKNTTPTISQAFNVLGNRMTATIGTMDKTLGISAGVATAIIALSNNFEQLSGYVIAAAGAVTIMYTPAIIAAARSTAIWIARLITLRGALMATGIGALVIGAGYLIGQLIRLRSETGSWGEALSALGDLAAGVWEGIKTSAESIVPALGAVWETVKAGFVKVLISMQKKWASFLRSVTGGLKEVGKVVPGMDGAILSVGTSAVMAQSEVYALELSANQMQDRAAALKEEAASLATQGFDKAREAAARLSEIMNKESDATSEAADEAKKLKEALDALGGGTGGNGGKGAGSGGSIDDTTSALTQLQKTTQSVADTIRQSMSDAFMSIVDGTKSAKDAFKDMARAILKKAFDLLVIQPIMNSIFGAFGGGFGGGGIPGVYAKGGVFDAGNVVPFANGGVVNRPTMFGMSGGRSGLMGEAGPEAIMPLHRGANGKLGVQSSGGGQGNVTVNQSFNFSANGDDSVKRIIAGEAPKLSAMALQKVMQERRRGGAVKQAFG